MYNNNYNQPLLNNRKIVPRKGGGALGAFGIFVFGSIILALLIYSFVMIGKTIKKRSDSAKANKLKR
jgi:uncharacterized membrane protein